MEIMKNKIAWLLVLLAFIGNTAISAANPNNLSKENEGYEITVKVDGKQDSFLILGNYWVGKMLPFDTAYYNKKKKSWTFKSEERAPEGIYFLFFRNNTVMDLVMGNNQFFELETDTMEGYIRNLNVKGDEENARYAEYKRSSIDFSKQMEVLKGKLSKDPSNEKLKEERTKMYKERRAYMTNYIAENPSDIFAKYMLAIKPIDVPDLKKENGDTDTFGRYTWYKTHYWDNVDFQEECMVRTPDEWLPRKITDYMTNLLYQHPDTAIKYADALLAKTKGNKEVDKYFIFKITQLYDTMQLMCMDKVFVHMVDKYYSTPRAYWVDTGTRRRMVEAAEKRRYTMCGATALNLNYYDLDSVPQMLYKHRGKYTIVVFYDPTCGHCKTEMPVIHELYSRKKSEGWTVYAIAAMNKKKEWKNYILKDNPTWTDWVNVCDVVPYRQWVDNRAAYNIVANPTILILNSQGQVIAKRIPAKNIESFIAEYERIFGNP